MSEPSERALGAARLLLVKLPVRVDAEYGQHVRTVALAIDEERAELERELKELAEEHNRVVTAHVGLHEAIECVTGGTGEDLWDKAAEMGCFDE